MNNKLIAYGRILAFAALISSFTLNNAEGQPGSQDSRNTSASTELLFDGDDIVTTATRTAQRLSDSPAAVTVISSEDIRASGATSIPELLRSLPGIDVMEPNQSQQNVTIRGYNSVYANTVLVMVDGRRINEDFNSSVFWNTDPILLSRIKRIEIVRGPESVLYGADAFSGVINIILKTPADLASESKQGAFVGQYENHADQFAEGNITIASKNKDLAVTVGAGYHGTNSQYKGNPDLVEDGSSVPIETIDVQKQTSRGSLLFSADNSDAKEDLATELVIPDGSFHTSSVALAYNEDRGANPVSARYYVSNFRIVGNQSYSSANSGELDIQQQRPVSPFSTLTYGATYRNNRATSTLTGPDTHSEHVGSLFLQDQDQINRSTTLFAGIREDDHSLYGAQISSRLSVVHHTSSANTLRLSYGTAFSAPTFIQNYIDSSLPIEPGLSIDYVDNTNLKPEEISSAEFGYRSELSRAFVGANIFYNKISNIIEPVALQFAPAPFPPGIPTEYMYQNLGTAHADGLEIEGGCPLSPKWNALINYSYQEVKNDNGQTEDFAPHNKVNITLQSGQKARWSQYLSTHFVSATTSNMQSLRAYTTVDAQISYRLGKDEDSWSASLASTNLLDDHHREYVDQSGLAPSLDISAPAVRTIRIVLSGSF